MPSGVTLFLFAADITLPETKAINSGGSGAGPRYARVLINIIRKTENITSGLDERHFSSVFIRNVPRV